MAAKLLSLAFLCLVSLQVVQATVQFRLFPTYQTESTGSEMASTHGPNLDLVVELGELPKQGGVVFTQDWEGFEIIARHTTDGSDRYVSLHAKGNNANPAQLFIYGGVTSGGPWNAVDVYITPVDGDALGFRLDGDNIYGYHRTGGVWSLIISGDLTLTGASGGTLTYLRMAGGVGLSLGRPIRATTSTTVRVDRFAVSEFTGAAPAFPAPETYADAFTQPNDTHVFSYGRWEEWFGFNDPGCTLSPVTYEIQSNRLENFEWTFPCGYFGILLNAPAIAGAITACNDNRAYWYDRLENGTLNALRYHGLTTGTDYSGSIVADAGPSNFIGAFVGTTVDAILRRGINASSRDFSVSYWLKFDSTLFSETGSLLGIYNGFGNVSPYDILRVFHVGANCYVDAYPGGVSSTVNNVFQDDGEFHHLELRGRLSTNSANTWIQDGAWQFLHDGVVILQASGVYLYPRNQMYHNQGTVKYGLWNEFAIQPHGAAVAVRAAKFGCNIGDPSSTCCGSSSPGPGGGGNGGTDPEPAEPLPSWTAYCAGNGAVPSIADLPDGEYFG